MEVWKPLVNLPHYEASNKGRIRSLLSNKILKQRSHKQGYKLIGLQLKDGSLKKEKTFTVHRLVAEAFLGPSDLQVNHKDLNKANNRITNLHYVTQSENIRHSFKNDPNRLNKNRAYKRLTSKIKRSDISRINVMRAKGFSQSMIANALKVSRQTIQAILSGKNIQRFKKER